MRCIKCGSYAINHHLHGRDGSRPDLCDVCFWRDKLESNLEAANERIRRLERCLDLAWGLIANAGQGCWEREHPDWKKAAEQWRDQQFHPIMSKKSVLSLKGPKP